MKNSNRIKKIVVTKMRLNNRCCNLLLTVNCIERWRTNHRDLETLISLEKRPLVISRSALPQRVRMSLAIQANSLTSRLEELRDWAHLT